MNKFLNASESRSNKWWQYVLTVVSVIVVFVIFNLLLQNILKDFQNLFPKNQFGEDLGMNILIGVLFGFALIALVFAIKKFHKASFFSIVNTDSKFNWLLYFKGFFIWGGLVFTGSLITDLASFETFIKTFNASHFTILLLVGLISIGVQSFFEEFLIRGYWLQGMNLKIKNRTLLVVLNGLIFAFFHLGYGIEAFFESWFFGIAFAFIVIKQKRIEFTAGAHNAHNLMLSLFFIDLAKALNEKFVWTINWLDFSIQTFLLVLLVLIVSRFISKNE